MCILLLHRCSTYVWYSYLRENGAGPILLFVIHLRPCKHGTHSLRLAVLVRSAATNTWLPHPCAGCIFVRTSATSIDSGNNRRTSALSLVPFASQLFSGSTLPLLSHVACTVLQDLYVQFCAGTAVLAADVYLVVPLLFYVLVLEWYRSYCCLCDKSTPVQARGTPPTLRLAVLVHVKTTPTRQPCSCPDQR